MDITYLSYTSILIIGVLFDVFCFRKVSLLVRKIILSGIIIVTIFLSGLRYETGSDWIPYLDYFRHGGDAGFEPGYTVLNELGRQLISNYNLFLVIIALPIFILSSISLIIPRYSIFILCCLLFQYFPVFLGGNRQMIAILLSLYAVRSLILNKKITLVFLTFSLFSFLFHSSAIMLMITSGLYVLATSYPKIVASFMSPFSILGRYLKQKKIFKLKRFTTLILFLLSLFLLRFIFLYLGDVLVGLLPFGRAAAYLDSATASIEGGGVFKDVPILAERFILLALIFFRWEDLTKSWQHNYIIYSHLAYTSIFIVFVGEFRIIAGRLSLYYRFADVFVYVLIALSFKGRARYLILIISALVMAARMYLSLHLNDYFLPYKLAL